jgi:hypothetical protein
MGGVQLYCQPDAGFEAQSEPLADIRTLRTTEWMKGLLVFVPDGSYA